MNKKKPSPLRFNFGFLLQSSLGTSRIVEIDYPTVRLEDDVVLVPLTGKFQALRTSKGIYISGKLRSYIQTECARCLTDTELPLTIELDDLFYYPPQDTPEGEFPVGDDAHVDLAPLVRQMSLLAVPMQPFCQEDCQGLCVQCGQNLNEGECDCETDDIDPRLAVLKTLLDS